MRKPATMLGVAAAGTLVAYGVYSYLKRRKQKQTDEIINDIMNDFKDANVFIKDPVGLRGKLKGLMEGGAEKMQCIADFDGTLTRGSYKGQPAQSSFAVVSRTALLPEDVERKEQELRAKYYPIERSSDKTLEEKCKAMEEWWAGIFRILEESSFTKQMIPDIVKGGTSVLREGCVYFLQRLNDEKIPLLVYSAGIGDIVEEVIQQQAADSTKNLDNITIISNYINWDSEGNMNGIKGHFLHSSNKGSFAESLDYKDTVKTRTNIILLGDNVGDSEMIKCAGNVEICLNIGFLNDNVNELRKDFEKLYDIVIADPESMMLVSVLLMKLLGRK
ncbi:cytosolic 5'-nucleotidase 3-like [Dendronephthya gigantea]|uniref:cytosolic 5'-nucleotidase 3-like n=1 Tax=Dendronephthya gigantea TaxID=151771 RepID=UPI00106B9E8E|nr:cytosolic 5'-nucleotidase 3-like [Dendronephthya gigantea]